MGVRGRSPVRDYILILIGASIMGFAIKNIYDPIGLVTGGVSGVAIILKKQLGVPLWLTNTAINVPLFAAAARLKGWKFIRRTLVATVALSVSLYVIPEIPFLMDDLLLTALFTLLEDGRVENLKHQVAQKLLRFLVVFLDAQRNIRDSQLNSIVAHPVQLICQSLFEVTQTVKRGNGQCVPFSQCKLLQQP